MSENTDDADSVDRMSDEEIERIIAEHNRHAFSEYDGPPYRFLVMIVLFTLAVKIVQFLLWLEELNKR